MTDGPFAETKELLAGYWMIQVKSKEEAIEWAKKVPFHMLPDGGDGPENRAAADVRARRLPRRAACGRRDGEVIQT